VPGVDRAWRYGIFLYCVVGGRTLGVTATIREGKNPEAVAMTVAKAVLGIH
jgi:hypothetical protein